MSRQFAYSQNNKSTSEMLETLYNEMTDDAKRRLASIEKRLVEEIKKREGSQEMGPAGAHELALRLVAATGGAILL
jgi:hypothetical protein